MEFHVSIHGSDRAGGTAAAPFRTISRAAAIAQPGDTVRVHAGTYREWVDPACGGVSPASRNGANNILVIPPCIARIYPCTSSENLSITTSENYLS